MRRTQSRLTQTGARGNRSRAFHRRATFEALEDRRLLSATVSFTTASETVEQSAGAFSIPVTFSGTAHRPPHRQALCQHVRRPCRFGLRLGRQPLCCQRGQHGGEVTPTGNVSTFASGFDVSYGLAFDSAGNLYVANDGNGTVSKVPPAAGHQHPSPPGSTIPSGLAFDSAGNLYVANSTADTVSKVPAGRDAHHLRHRVRRYPYGLAFDSAGNLYVANEGNSTVSEVPKAGGPPILFASGFDGPSAWPSTQLVIFTSPTTTITP